MRSKEAHKIRDVVNLRHYFDEEYFEGDGKRPKSGYVRYHGGYSKLEEAMGKHFHNIFNMANRYTKGCLDVFAGQGKKALEIGCAYGYGLKVIQRLGYQAYGIDISEYAIGRAGDICEDVSDVVVADAQQLPFKGLQFDLIACFDVMEHLPQPELMVAECYRLLKHSGLFVATSDNKNSLYGRLVMRDDATHINMRGPQGWRNVFARYDWQRLRILCFERIPKTEIRFVVPYLGNTIMILAQK